MGIPTVKTIKTYLGLRGTTLGETKAANLVRKAMEWAETGEAAPSLVKWADENIDHRSFGYYVIDPFDARSYSDRIRHALVFIDKITEGFGVEYIPAHQDTFHSVYGVEYVNQGDTYTPTVYYDHGTGKWHVGDWGWVVENSPSRFGE